jgi:hypothetical protein
MGFNIETILDLRKDDKTDMIKKDFADFIKTESQRLNISEEKVWNIVKDTWGFWGTSGFDGCQ